MRTLLPALLCGLSTPALWAETSQTLWEFDAGGSRVESGEILLSDSLGSMVAGDSGFVGRITNTAPSLLDLGTIRLGPGSAIAVTPGSDRVSDADNDNLRFDIVDAGASGQLQLTPSALAQAGSTSLTITAPAGVRLTETITLRLLDGLDASPQIQVTVIVIDPAEVRTIRMGIIDGSLWAVIDQSGEASQTASEQQFDGLDSSADSSLVAQPSSPN
jgi:hypothetical protein